MSATDIKLGSLIFGHEKRDAIHIAIAPVVAGHSLSAGAHVGLDAEGRAIASPNPIGIVDPFLTNPVVEGQKFWLCLYQKTVTGMRHEWRHPHFPDRTKDEEPEAVSEARSWIANFADEVGISYQELMDGADQWIVTKGYEYLCFGGLLEGKSVPEEFWDHFKTITGKKGKGSFFTCSC